MGDKRTPEMERHAHEVCGCPLCRAWLANHPSPASGAAPQLLSDDRLREILNDWCEDKDYSLADVRRDLALAAPAADKLRDLQRDWQEYIDEMRVGMNGLVTQESIRRCGLQIEMTDRHLKQLRAALEAAATEAE